MIGYLKKSFRRKIARRITKEYPSILTSFDLQDDGHIEFANWDNPLVSKIKITQSNVDFFKQFIYIIYPN